MNYEQREMENASDSRFTISGSDRLDRDVWELSLSYQKVVSVYNNGEQHLDCGHDATASDVVHYLPGDSRYCQQCTIDKYLKILPNQAWRFKKSSTLKVLDNQLNLW